MTAEQLEARIAYNSSAATPRAQVPYQEFGVPLFMRFDSKGRYSGLTSGDES
ncbi:hypothetical protein BDM02DRAFT_3122482 [Thelephora ganbajun]|uniref:Uncharacterized protein n=1 Tax=Thelephora ganbajun TaxID=370292 RepID=A0ACB6Z404_THEGA|nr:hypothetical protein BDM02DRAFT_3122482 [Thelephora ganbajun]